MLGSAWLAAWLANDWLAGLRSFISFILHWLKGDDAARLGIFKAASIASRAWAASFFSVAPATRVAHQAFRVARGLN
jgi:hypothetical protein